MDIKKVRFSGEAALLIVLIINSLGVDLMTKSGFGISTISSVPLIFSTAFSFFSFGTWNYIFQTLLVITLMVLKKSFCPSYFFSFIVGLGFGPGFSYPVLYRGLHPDLLRHLPGKQLHASYHPYGHLPSRSLRDHPEEI